MTANPCKYLWQCGGCSLAHDEHYYESKNKQVADYLADVAQQVLPMQSFAVNSRRRASFKVTNNKLAFNKARSHQLVAIAHCLVLNDEINQLITPINALMLKLALAITGVDITNSDAGISLCFKAKVHPRAMELQLIVDFALINQLAQVAWQVNAQSPYLVLQLKQPILKYLDCYINLPINSFMQASHAAQSYMIAVVLEHLDFSTKILELYCGCGGFTIAIAQHAKVDAYEGIAEAVMAIKQTASRHKLATNALKRDLYQNPLTKADLNHYTQVLINPPRNGATPQIKQIALADKVNTVILISCSLENFKRDALLLIKSNFVLQKVYPVDQFIYTDHVEIVGVFRR